LTVPLRSALAAVLDTAGPCPACGARRSAPLCRACREASGIAERPFAADLDGRELHFLGGYHADPAARGEGRLSPLGHCVRSFKDRRDRYAGRCLALLFARAFDEFARADRVIIVPVPSDPERLRQRGHSPSAWLARALARRSGGELCLRALRRAPGRPPQRGLSGSARRANAAGAFETGQASPRGRPAVIADDVVTTGATLRDAARCLVRAGASEVVALVLACADEGMMAACRSRIASAGTNDTGELPP
jgi:ComF family protein